MRLTEMRMTMAPGTMAIVGSIGPNILCPRFCCGAQSHNEPNFYVQAAPLRLNGLLFETNDAQCTMHCPVNIFTAQ
jgi:hypothetical protein